MNAEIKPDLLKPRWKKVLTDLWDDKTRTGLVVASIAVGVFAVGMILTAYTILAVDVPRSFASVNPPNIEVVTDSFDKDFVHVIEQIPGVEDAEGRRTISVRARNGDQNWKKLGLVGLSDFTGQINLLDPIEGTQFPGENEAILSQSQMNVSGFHPGDILEIEFPDRSTHQLTVVGLVTDQAYAQPTPGETNNIYVSLRTLRLAGQTDYFNKLYVTVDGDGADTEFISSVASAVEDKVTDSQRQVYRTDERLSNEHPMIDSMLAILGTLGMLGGLIAILSSSLIINTLNALLTQQLRQIGIMKLVGGRSYQIMGMYLTLIIGYGLIAVLISVPLGAFAGYGLAWLMASMLSAVLQGFRVVPLAMVVQVLMATLIPLATGFFPVMSGVKTSVQKAINDYRPGDQAAKSSLIKASWISWISRPILLSFRNTFRKKGRLLLTIFTLTVAGGVFIAVFNVRNSMTIVMSQLTQHFLGDITLDLRQPYQVSKVKKVLLEIPGIQDVEGWGGAPAEIVDENGDLVTNLNIVAPPNETKLLTLDFVAGRGLLPNEKKALVIADTIYADYPNLQVGDTLRIQLNGKPEEDWEVVGIFRYVSMLGDPMAYANFEYIADRLTLPGQATSYRITTQNPQDVVWLGELIGQIDSQLSSRDFSVKTVQAGAVTRETATTAVNTIVAFLLVMAILTAFVGSIGLTGTMSINVMERTREIGVMRTIGAVDLVIMQSVIIEGLVIGLITWVLAIGLSFPISSVLRLIIGQAMMGSAITLEFTSLGLLIWLGVVSVLSVVASIAPARNAAKLTINEVLAYE